MTIEQLRYAAAINFGRQEQKTKDFKAVESISLTIIICSVIVIAVLLVFGW